MPRTDQEPISVFTISPSTEFTTFVLEQVRGAEGMAADGSTTDLKTALEEVKDVEPNVVVLDKALVGNLVRLSKRIRAGTVSARIVLAGHTVSATEARFLFQAGVNGFLTKPELDVELLPTLSAVADQKTRFSPQVRDNLRSHGEIGPFLNSPLPEVPEDMKESLQEVGYSREPYSYRRNPALEEFRQLSDTKGLFAPFRFAIHLGILPVSDVSELVPRMSSMSDSYKTCLREYLRCVPSTRGAEVIEYDHINFNATVSNARARLESPSYAELIQAAAASGLLSFDEIGSRELIRPRRSISR